MTITAPMMGSAYQMGTSFRTHKAISMGAT